MTIQFGKLVRKTFTSPDGLFHAFRLRCRGGEWVNANCRGENPPEALQTVEYELHGDWSTHPTYGKIFVIRAYRRAPKEDHQEEREPLIGSLKTLGHFPTPQQEHKQ